MNQGEIKYDTAEDEEYNIEELKLWPVNDGCQYQVDGYHQKNDWYDDWYLE